MSARLRRAAFGVAFLVVVTAGTAVAADPGDPWLLGVTNTIDSATELTGTVAERIVKITNEGTGRALSLLATTAASSGTLLVTNAGDGVGVQISVKDGARPISVNATAGKATNLNVDKLDGLDSTDLQKRVWGDCPGNKMIQAINADGTVFCSSPSSDASTLDGVDSTGFMKRPIYRKTVQGTGTCPNPDACYLRVDCDTGDALLSGGFDSLDNGTRLMANRPGKDLGNNSQPTSFGWVVWWDNNATPDTVEVTVICANQ
jgi:hypothetical protein